MKLKVYEELRQTALNCKKCDLGCDKVDDQDPHVFGEGNLNSKIVFIAEAPGKQETIFKHPLIPPGKSGLIYERVLSGLGLTREQVYTCNTIVCRPERNADPLPYQSLACRSFLDAQLGLIQPKLIITFGRFAALTFLSDFKITRDHGKIQRCDRYNADIFALYHPAYVSVYAPQNKKEEFKQDLKYLKTIIGNYLR